jgi:lipid II isoglutaminyl synthase (glutamine-hydrolysing)
MSKTKLRSLHVVQLYPKEMNIYGDQGNFIILKNRIEWRGYTVKHSVVNVGDSLPKDIDILIGGGGQDSGQMKVEADLISKAGALRALSADGVSMLMICGLYQMFGGEFVTSTGETVDGIGIFDLVTKAGDERLIGNILTTVEGGKQMLGFENHSGKTYLGPSQKALGRVESGHGNNGQDGTEGAVSHNTIGTYMHGPVLSKNPWLADKLIKSALSRKYGEEVHLRELDDSMELAAFEQARRRS